MKGGGYVHIDRLIMPIVKPPKIIKRHVSTTT